VGPLAGGLLVDGLGWEWIFFINVPVGIVAFVMAWIFVPNLPTHAHRFDIPGVILSAVGLFLIVFGLQEGEHYDWGVIWGPITVWMLIIAGVIVMGIFIWTQARTKNEPLVPLELFKDRNFGVSNFAIATVGFTVTSMSLPLMFFIQLARGLTPTQAALLLVPMALLTGILSPFAGRLLDRVDPRLLLVPGLLMVSGSLLWYSTLMNADTPIWMFLLPSALMGIGNAGMWGPLATTATRNLPMSQAGAGAGIYNTTRTVGSVIGSAAIAAFMQSRLEANLPGASEATGGFGGGTLPAFVVDGFSTAMAQAILLPACVMVVALIASLFLGRYDKTEAAAPVAARAE
jgi:MFS family permease